MMFAKTTHRSRAASMTVRTTGSSKNAITRRLSVAISTVADIPGLTDAGLPGPLALPCRMSLNVTRARWGRPSSTYRLVGLAPRRR